MKSRRLKFVVGFALLAELATPFLLVAQKTSYKLIDIGTLGGPSAHGPGNGPGAQLINNSGTVAGSAETSTPDPNAPNCANPDCFLGHAFSWEGGAPIDLGTIPGGSVSGASAINARGWIAGGSTTPEIDPFNTGCGFQPLCPQFHGTLWKNGGIIDIGTLGEGLESNTTYVNDAGEVVGFSTINTSPDPFSFLGAPTHAFIWRNGVMRDLGTLGGPDSFASGGCNNQRPDLVAGSSFTDSIPNPDTGVPTQDPFLWENGKMKDLGTLGGTFGTAQCANNRGEVIGQSSLIDGACSLGFGAPGCHAFLWNGAAISDLGTLGGTFSEPNWLNENGDAVGVATTTNDESFHATLWRQGGITDLGTLRGDCFSIAWAINSKGQIVGQSFSCDGSTLRTFLWDKGSISDLHVASSDPLNINDRGEIAGVYLPDGCQNLDLCSHAFVLVPCNNAGVQGCDIIVQPNPAAITTRADKAAPDPQKTRELVARLRARLAQRYRGSGLGAPQH